MEKREHSSHLPWVTNSSRESKPIRPTFHFPALFRSAQRISGVRSMRRVAFAALQHLNARMVNVVLNCRIRWDVTLEESTSWGTYESMLPSQSLNIQMPSAHAKKTKKGLSFVGGWLSFKESEALPIEEESKRKKARNPLGNWVYWPLESQSKPGTEMTQNHVQD